MTDDSRQTIAALIDGAELVDDARPAAPDFEEPTRATFADGGDAESQAGGAFPGDYDGDEAGPSDKPPKSDVDMGAVETCAPLDHSDTDNGKRLIAHFGRDLLVLRQADAQRPAFVTWAGTHWDIDGGGPGSLAISQQVGGRIALEADFITATIVEKMMIERGDKAFDELDRLEAKKEPSDADKARMRFLRKEIEDGLAAEQAVEKRQVARRKFAVSSKNKARLEAMLACAAPHIQRDPEAFNRDPLKFATRGHTLTFSRILDPDRSQEDPREDGTRPMIGWCDAEPWHRREDLITKLVPVDYDPKATCPKWDAFLEEFLPVEPVRRLVQTFSGLGLTGLTVQKILFHYGLGANGKSVFMETLMRVLGPLAVGLPAESITGTGERGAGQASPDLARLFGVRTLRILELPADKPLQEEMLKKLTGGESIPVRSLFKGYYEFTPVFSGHMSGNGHLKQRLDPNQRFGLNGIATRLDQPVDVPPALPIDDPRPPASVPSAPVDPVDPVEERIKREKLRQAELVTAKLEREDRAAHGAYVRTEAAREEMTRIAATLLTIFEGALPDLSGALAAQFSISGRDALHLLRQQFRKIRERAAAAHREAAVAMPETEEDDQATTD
jgi:putative DNA primase/helicase